MIDIEKGNILQSKAEAVINTVNTKGVMGKGIALQFKEAYPVMFNDYKNACKEGRVAVGKMFVWRNPSFFGPRYIINFPTKDDWRQPSKIEYIKTGLIDLAKVICEFKIHSIAIPPLGCGNGGLNWAEVKPLVVSSLQNIVDLSVKLFEPTDEIRSIDPVKSGPRQMTVSRALVLKLFQKYSVLGYELTLLEIQKLCFLLQEFGEPLNLHYKKHMYGPFADNIHLVLIDFEGTYTKGYNDTIQNQPDTVIELLPQAIQEADTFIELNKATINESLQRLEQVEALIEGFETPFGMELLSMVYWTIKYEHVPQSDEELLIDTVRSWNPHKTALMKPAFIKKVIKQIEKCFTFDNVMH